MLKGFNLMPFKNNNKHKRQMRIMTNYICYSVHILLSPTAQFLLFSVVLGVSLWGGPEVLTLCINITVSPLGSVSPVARTLNLVYSLKAAVDHWTNMVHHHITSHHTCCDDDTGAARRVHGRPVTLTEPKPR